MEWFAETLHEGWQQRMRVERVLHRQKTAHQDLVLFENRQWGKVLALDGVVQTTTGDEFAYHEMLVHVPLMAQRSPKRVLIVGGGDGGSLREVLKHASVERVTQVEIDRSVVEFSRAHLPELSQGAFDDPRLELVIADGAAFVRGTPERFDAIIVDSTDPIGPGRVLFEAPFYRHCRRALAPGGVMTTMSGNPAIDPDEFRLAFSNQRAAGFADVAFYLTVVPTYVGGHMALGWACDDTSLRPEAAAHLADRSPPEGLRYYTREVHRAAFAIPGWLNALVG